jgi:uncharacterized surface protein with fasciclin (FAS1) repeats
MSNITQVVNVEKTMTTFKKGMHASDLDQLLSSRGPFTVFAPTDQAFGKLDKGAFPSMLEKQNKVQLTELLRHHIVEGKVAFADLKDGDKLKTLHGNDLSVSIADSKVSIDGMMIHSHDMSSSNGVIHSLDGVLN